MRIPHLLPLALLALVGCVTFASTNRPLPPAPPTYHGRASLTVHDGRGDPRTLVCLAISGGGSRAAYFGAMAMARLATCFPDIDLLREVDLITAVSGGTLPAAYYCLSQDPDGWVQARIPGGVDLQALPATLASRVAWRGERQLLGLHGPLSAAEAVALTAALHRPEEAPRLARLVAASRVKLKGRRTWSAVTVRRLMQRNFLRRWIGNWFWPGNIARYWFTAYDRSDIMAQTLADNLFDARPFGADLRYRDLNPERPYLVLNATEATGKVGDARPFGAPFRFTHERFVALGSDIDRYRVARAVMASASFPAVFNYMTLRDYHEEAEAHRRGERGKRYRHLFDGGTSDNLGLTAVKEVIARNHDRFDRIVVISIDAFVHPAGVSPERADPRPFISRVIDTNLFEAMDSLLKTIRKDTLQKFRTATYDGAPVDLADKLTFCHLSFDGLPEGELRERLDTIATNFRLAKGDAAAMDQAVVALVSAANPQLKAVRAALLAGE